MDAKATRKLEVALRKAYAQAVSARAERALRVLTSRHSSGELETLLGLSKGGLARLTKGGRSPSAAMTGLLMLLAERHSRVAELRALWGPRLPVAGGKKSAPKRPAAGTRGRTPRGE